MEKWWKIFGGKLLVKIFSRLGGDQLTGMVELTVGDKLTERGPVDFGDLTNADRGSYACIYHQTFNMAGRGSYACIYEGKINGDTNQPSTNHQI